MTVFKIKGRDGKPTRLWYGKIRLAPGRWSPRIRLSTDKTASERELAKLQARHDRGVAGLHAPDTDRLKLPIATLKDQYLDSMRRQGLDADHVRITDFMTTRLIAL